MLGDVVGEPGLRGLQQVLPHLRELLQIGFVVVNGENAHASGRGITDAEAKRIFGAGADCITGGNHSFAQNSGPSLHDRERRILRPLNYPAGAEVPGRGSGLFEAPGGCQVAVINLAGQVLMQPFENPFAAFDREYSLLRDSARIVLLDFHAETTSEKCCMGWHADGRASVVVGTHTHIPTADATVLPNGTGYITDLGMSGPYRSVIGVRADIIRQRLTTLLPSRHVVATEDVRVCGVLADVEELTGRTRSVARVEVPVEGSDPDWRQAEHLAQQLGEGKPASDADKLS